MSLDFNGARAGRQDRVDDACCGWQPAANVGAAIYTGAVVSTLAPRGGSELPLVDVMQSVPLAHTYWPIVFDRSGT